MNEENIYPVISMYAGTKLVHDPAEQYALNLRGNVFDLCVRDGLWLTSVVDLRKIVMQ